MEDWTNVIDSGASADVIYVDFQKVFDRVPHSTVGYYLKLKPMVLREVF